MFMFKSMHMYLVNFVLFYIIIPFSPRTSGQYTSLTPSPLYPHNTTEILVRVRGDDWLKVTNSALSLREALEPDYLTGITTLAPPTQSGMK